MILHSSFLALAPGVAEALQRAEPLAPSAAQRTAFTLSSSRSGNAGPRLLTINGSVADIRIEGVLTPRPDLFAFLFGGGNSAYGEIIEALETARQNASVKSARLLVDSPGGTVAGVLEAVGAIEGFKASGKTIEVVATQALSAAYWLSAAAGKITAAHAGAMFGSIGVAASFFTSDRVVDITSTHAPDKRPSLQTEAGRQVVREQLDEIHELFVASVAEGRGTTRADVNANYGRGRTVIAGGALTRGMIDGVATKLPNAKYLTPGSDTAFAVQLRALESVDAQRRNGSRADDGRDLGDKVCDAMFGSGWEKGIVQ